MADVNKPKLQLRSGLSINGDKTPSPATKLLISHGKPNFTIQRSPKAQNGNANPLSPTPAVPVELKSNNNNNEFVVKSTTFNGVFKPSNVSAATKQTLQENGNSNGHDNEAAKVVLRRAKVVQTETREVEEDGNVPEFILRQRRIQERLANQNILDFENRRSGYFTQVMISPSSPNRQSFVETMASPAVKPGLEMPPPPTPQEDIKEETAQEQQEEQEQEHEQQQQQQQQEEIVHEKSEPETVVQAEAVTLHVESITQDEEEEVAKAIEEVNKAVEGEDDDKTELEEHLENHQEESVTTLQQVEETKPEEENVQEELAPVVAAVTTSAVVEEEQQTPIVAAVVTSAPEVTEEQPLAQQNGHVEAAVTSAPLIEDNAVEAQTNGMVEEQSQPLQNGHTTNGEAVDNTITISHTNGLNGPSLPSPDPTGEKGVNFEPKTVVSFSQELGNNVNKYPDTVKVLKEGETAEVDNELKELTKLKFEIKGDDQDIEVKSVLITETA